jgi:hypothetical protein
MVDASVLDEVVEIEWDMFHNVNDEAREDCQENRPTFEAMRRAQYSTWSEEALESYLRDLRGAVSEGRNLLREKYAHMMEVTDPQGYEALKDTLPPVSDEKRELVAELWKHFESQTLALRKDYPVLGMAGRPLYAADVDDGQTSLETYQTGEMLTYSETTLRALLAHVRKLEEQGTSLVRQIQENSVTCLGYASLEDAERAIVLEITQASEA